VAELSLALKRIIVAAIYVNARASCAYFHANVFIDRKKRRKYRNKF